MYVQKLSSNPKNMMLAVLAVCSSSGAFLFAALPAIAQVTFSMDAQGPSMGALPTPPPPGPMFEGDILTPAGGPPPFPGTPLLTAPPPRILIPAAPVVLGPPDLGLFPFAPQEVDALSYGTDDLVPPVPWLVNSFYFSVDEFATGVAGAAAGPTVFNQGALSANLEAAADTFVNAFTIAAPPPVLPPPSPPAGNVAVFDGNGLVNAAGVAYPGVGLVEPNSPFIPGTASLDPGDNLDALDVDTTPIDLFGDVYFSLDSGFDDPLELAPGPNFGSAVANGFVGGDVLVSAPGGVPAVFAPAGTLGLDLIDVDLDGFPDMDSDDLDALILWENGTGIFEPSMVPYDWMGGGTDMLLFSVRRGSAVVGMPDSRYGVPISEGDVLTTPIPVAFGGLSRFPAIFVPAEYLGLATIRSGTAVVLFGTVPFNDDLDALDFVYRPDCNSNGIWDRQDVIAGTSEDCNGNFVPDECEIPPIGPTTNDCNFNGIPDDCDVNPADPDGNGMVSLDCQPNGVPDECELAGNDCNGNGIPDDCDIAGPTSDDCNNNGIPDECDIDPTDPDGNGLVSPDCQPNGIPDECEVALGPVDFDESVLTGYQDDPCGIAAADVDGDGDADLLITVTQENRVYLLRNNGDGTFAAPTGYTVGGFPWFVTTADVNGDSDLDVITANNTGASVTIRQNMNGLGGFTNRNDFAVGTGPRSVAAADFDGDGDVDLAVTNSINNNVTILRLQGFGTSVQGSATYATGMYPYSIVTGDLDSDGDQDLVVTNTSSDTLSVLFNNGAGVFSAPVSYASGDQPQWLALGDLDRDGDLDVVASTWNPDRLYVWRNNGAGALLLDSAYPVGDRPVGVAVADLDGDGDLDVIVANSGGFTSVLFSVSVLLNNGYGGLAPEINLPTTLSVGQLTVADFDRNGYPDLALAANNAILLLRSGMAPDSPDCNSNGVPDSCDLADGTDNDCNGNGILDSCELQPPIRLTPAVTQAINYGPGLAAADFDADGDVDIAQSGFSATFRLLRNNGNAVFAEANVISVGIYPHALTAADLDGDGDQDAVVSDYGANNVYLLQNNGAGALAIAATRAVPATPVAVTTADLDGDNDPDVVTVHPTSNAVVVMLNAGAFSLGTPSSFYAGPVPRSIAAARLDSDADVDLVVGHENTNYVTVLPNSGTGTFPTVTNWIVGYRPIAVAAADVDGDGDNDVIAAIDNVYDPAVAVLRNNGNGNFAAAETYAVAMGPSELVALDLNGDGRPDLAVSCMGSTPPVVCVLENRGDGTFLTAVRHPIYGSATSGILPLIAADLNRDRRPDLAAMSNSPLLAVLLNNSTLPADAPQTFESYPALPIPDGPTGTVTTPPIAVPLTGSISDVDVQIDIQHPWLGDLSVTLLHSDGTEVVLVPASTRGFANYTGTVFDDEAVHQLWAGNGPYTGRYRPVPPARLATLYDHPASGDWRLRVADTTPGSTGTILHWAVTIRTHLLDCIMDGDVDGNGNIDGGDISGFTACYLSGSAGGPCAAADMDDDGDVDDDDLALFLAALL